MEGRRLATQQFTEVCIAYKKIFPEDVTPDICNLVQTKDIDSATRDLQDAIDVYRHSCKLVDFERKTQLYRQVERLYKIENPNSHRLPPRPVTPDPRYISAREFDDALIEYREVLKNRLTYRVHTPSPPPAPSISKYLEKGVYKLERLDGKFDDDDELSLSSRSPSPRRPRHSPPRLPCPRDLNPDDLRNRLSNRSRLEGTSLYADPRNRCSPSPRNFSPECLRRSTSPGVRFTRSPRRWSPSRSLGRRRSSRSPPTPRLSSPYRIRSRSPSLGRILSVDNRRRRSPSLGFLLNDCSRGRSRSISRGRTDARRRSRSITSPLPSVRRRSPSTPRSHRKDHENLRRRRRSPSSPKRKTSQRRSPSPKRTKERRRSDSTSKKRLSPSPKRSKDDKGSENEDKHRRRPSPKHSKSDKEGRGGDSKDRHKRPTSPKSSKDGDKGRHDANKDRPRHQQSPKRSKDANRVGGNDSKDKQRCVESPKPSKGAKGGKSSESKDKERPTSPKRSKDEKDGRKDDDKDKQSDFKEATSKSDDSKISKQTSTCEAQAEKKDESVAAPKKNDQRLDFAVISSMSPTDELLTYVREKARHYVAEFDKRHPDVRQFVGSLAQGSGGHLPCIEFNHGSCQGPPVHRDQNSKSRIHSCCLCYFSLGGLVNLHALNKCPLLGDTM